MTTQLGLGVLGRCALALDRLPGHVLLVGADALVDDDDAGHRTHQRADVRGSWVGRVRWAWTRHRQLAFFAAAAAFFAARFSTAFIALMAFVRSAFVLIGDVVVLAAAVGLMTSTAGRVPRT